MGHSAIALLLVISVSVITANPVPRAEITPPAEVADPIVTTERITTTNSAGAATTTIVSAQETTQDSPVQPTAENRTEPPQQQQESDDDKEPSKGLVSFDQRQHGRFNIRADLDNFMIILVPQSASKSPLLSLGSLGALGGGGGGGSSSFGSASGSSLLDLFTRKATTKRYNGGSSRRKYKVKSSSYKRKYKEMLKKQQEAEEREAAVAVPASEEVSVVPAAPVAPAAVTSVNSVEEQPLKKFDSDFSAKDEIEDRTTTFDKPISDKYRMDTLEKIQHQLDILIKRVDAREASFDRVHPKEHFVEGRTPYRVEIGSLTNEPEARVDILPSPQHPVPFRQFRTDGQPLQIGNHGPQPKFFQPWTFPSAAAPDNSPINPFGQRPAPVMVAFRDGRSLGPQAPIKGNSLGTGQFLALPLNPFGRSMDVESNEIPPFNPPTYSILPALPPLPNSTDNELAVMMVDSSGLDDGAEEGEMEEELENPFLEHGFIDLTDTVHSFDSLNVDNVDKIDNPTSTAQFNQDWDLKLLGATDDCGPDRRRDSYGICQFIQF